MIIIKEKKLTEGVDIQAIQKDVAKKIANLTIHYGSSKGQMSSSQKIFVGVVLGALRGLAEWLNPFEGNFPQGSNPNEQKIALSIQADVLATYKKNILTAINDLEKIYTKQY
jgi:hypothetical protein